MIRSGRCSIPAAWLGLVAIAAGLLATVATTSGGRVTGSDPAVTARARTALAKLQTGFEANLGQANGEVRYLARGSGYTLGISPTEAVLALALPEPAPAKTDRKPHFRTQAILDRMHRRAEA